MAHKTNAQARMVAETSEQDADGSDAVHFHNGTLSRREYLTLRVEAALRSVRAYLSPKDAALVRSVLRTSIEHDPASRLLVANALRSQQLSGPTPGDDRISHRNKNRRGSRL